jgi:hypothetical protein
MPGWAHVLLSYEVFTFSVAVVSATGPMKIEVIAENKATRSTGYLLSKELETSARERYVLAPRVNLCKSSGNILSS